MEKDVTAMQKLIDLVVGKDNYSYPMNKNAARPKEPFVAVKLLDEDNPGTDTVKIKRKGKELITQVEGIRIVRFILLFTDTDIEQTLFTASMRLPLVIDAMEDYNIAVLETEHVVNETLDLETNWEVRNGLIVSCLIARSFEARTREDVPTSVISSVSVTGNII